MRPLERQTVHELVDRYAREEMHIRDNDRKGRIPFILQDDIAQLAPVELLWVLWRRFLSELGPTDIQALQITAVSR
ncbi:hypothetical protein [Acetobacter orleanensis]|uniref:Uncharacterized protein n=1 Tax=Acetobacter orleanensis TaxID=104099 RepID=A0A4Y3TTQ2_9PROT|nr:hypothetical protein [Acetobacter orleanensis]GAN69720.1 phage DNA recombinase [Acetobacter orleanensis JCM 7639]GBR31589.1 hypothetical protein AA0473_2582 [Acetobacter orleanensis NRIC 0473]GEB84155.1 hypothetical protein AOR01nite_26320 [Acetobacter orleanensis]